MTRELLSVKDLRTYFYTYNGVVKAVDGVSFEINEGEVFALVGETGCGKSATALSIMRLIQEPGKIVGGEIIFDGQDLLRLDGKEMRKIRGGKIAMIFQDPTSSLNPVYTVGNQISETVVLHQALNKKKAWEKSMEMLDIVRIPSATSRARDYPHEFSGGMKQRVMIAMSLSCQPKLLIADEPTTALDVTIQLQILELMKELKNKLNTSILLITHDLGVVAEMCNRVAIMYAGKIVETSTVREIFKHPNHPYTLGLLNAIPLPHRRRDTLEVIPGTVPSLIDIPSGCRFHPRCRFAKDICKEKEPLLEETSPGHFSACHFHEEVVREWEQMGS